VALHFFSAHFFLAIAAPAPQSIRNSLALQAFLRWIARMSESKIEPPADGEPPVHQPFVPDSESPPEFTWPALLAGALLGIVFGASSLYLLLKVGMTVSASVPIAVLSITLFRFLSQTFGFRRATILENNVVQTAGSAGESIAFGVGVTMPALLLLGFEMNPIRVMTVSVLGGLLGILMMIPLRRAFIVKQHGKLVYPEGTACAEVLIAGEKGGATAKMVFVGFGIAAVYTFLMRACKFWADKPTRLLYGESGGLKGAAISGDVSPELLGVGYLIGPRIACLMLSGAILSYFVLGPLIASFGAQAAEPIGPADWEKQKDAQRDMIVGAAAGVAWSLEHDKGLVRNMGPDEISDNYLTFIGAGAVAAGGIISMARAMPMIISSIVAGLRDLRSSRGGKRTGGRTETDMPMITVLFGSIGLVLIIAAIPQLGLGFNLLGILGALMILVFGFLFVTVSSRLTGEVGSSSNPISGMTIATLLLVCLIFFVLDKRDAPAMLTALMIAAVVCIASSNGGTTSQDLKTGFLVGATPRKQQYAILVGALTSAVAIGFTMLKMNEAQTHYTVKNLPEQELKVPTDAPTESVGRPYEERDHDTYHVLYVRNDDKDNPGVKPGRYLVDRDNHAKYRADLPIDQREAMTDFGKPAPNKFDAPQPRLFQSIIEGILGGNLEWGLVIAGAFIAIALELAGVSALPFAVGMYIPLSSSLPIFIGGVVRWLTELIKGTRDSETDTSPGILLSSGYIAGGTLCGLIIVFFNFLPESFGKAMELGPMLFAWDVKKDLTPTLVALPMYLVIVAILFVIGLRKQPKL
jgi:OPT family oligopeptide transporter